MLANLSNTKSNSPINDFSISMKTIALLFYLFIPFYLSAQPECHCSIDYGNNPEAGKFISVNNIKMYYETYGNPEHEPLLLIHGNGGSDRTVRSTSQMSRLLTHSS